MLLDINQKDLYLLKNNPNQLILDLQDLIDIIIHQFIRSGYFHFDEKQEVKQQINIELFNRLANIQKQYQGKSSLRTYLAVIIRNICNEILRNGERTKFILFVNNYKFDEESENIYPLIFEEEMLRLKKIINLYFRQKHKLQLCLKLKFKMIVDLDDFKNLNKNITQDEFKNFVNLINPYSDCADNKIFTALTTILNKYEDKNNTPDSLRKWVTDKINEIIDILNGTPPTSKYDKETFQILFEKCHFKEHSTNTNQIRIEL